MNFLARWVARIRRSPASPAPALAATPSEVEVDHLEFDENRSVRRVPLGFRSQLCRPQERPVDCTLADASGGGVRLHVDQPLEVGSLAGVVIHFNGYFLRMRLRVVWSRADGNGWEVGASAIPSPFADGGLLENFNRYLRWREGVYRAA